MARWHSRFVRSALPSATVGWLLGATAFAQATTRVSVGTGDVQGRGFSSYPAISADGRFVAFASLAPNLVAGDTNGEADVFVRDRVTGATTRVNVATDGTQSEGEYSYGLPLLALSADGQHVAFASHARNLVPGDTNGVTDIFVHDRPTGVTTRVSMATWGEQANDSSQWPSISADGRIVAFESAASNLVGADTNGASDVFVHDLQSGLTTRVSVGTGGSEANHGGGSPSISADARFVAFTSLSNDLVPGDTNNRSDIFVHDRMTGTTTRVSVATGGAEAHGQSYWPSISADGTRVAFWSTASDLVAGDSGPYEDVFVHDLALGVTTRVSVSSSGVEGNDGSGYFGLAISGDGRSVAFWSKATNLVPGGATHGEVFLHELASGATTRMSVSTNGAPGRASSGYPSLAGDGRQVAFTSIAGNLVSGDSNLTADVFVHDRDAASFTSLCDPGVAGVLGCPCSNPAAGPQRGCDNGSATGGAILSATGIAYLSMDSLVFEAVGENPTATSILFQGDALAASGVVYGHGVRCAGGSIRRLFVKTAVSGGITAPDFASGDFSVSARSAEQGDVIQPGESRWYVVGYRDRVVLGGCAATSTLNATQTGQVSWWP
jgi:Tol biopolymer transport system component